MCYSAQVKLFAKCTGSSAFDWPTMRPRGFCFDDSTINISRGFEANLDEPTTDQARRIKSAIDEHHSRVAGKIEKDLFTQTTRLVTAERSLKTKETRKSREDVRIAIAKPQRRVSR